MVVARRDTSRRRQARARVQSWSDFLVPHLLQHLEALTCSTLQARDWIHESLYDPAQGYFNRPNASPVGQLPDPIHFPQVAGQQAYLQHLRLWYDTLKVLSLTPAFSSMGTCSCSSTRTPWVPLNFAKSKLQLRNLMRTCLCLLAARLRQTVVIGPQQNYSG